MVNSNDNEYVWTVADVRALDNRLQGIESKVDTSLADISGLRKELTNNHTPLVVDNRSKTDWKAIAVLIGATVATILASIQQVISK